MRFRSFAVTSIVAVAALSAPPPAQSQTVVPVHAFPRTATIEQAESVQVIDRILENSGELSPDSVRKLETSRARLLASRAGATTGVITWTRFSEIGAAQFWQSDQVTLLSAATLSPGEENTALYTELVSVLTGAWRVGLGTTLAVGTEERQENPADPAEVDDTGFRRFLAGGGNLSLAAYRPVRIGIASSSSHLFFLIPRVWANVPNLTPTEGVNDFGGEFGVEYQYLRFQTEWKGGGLEREDIPFLAFHGRVALATGPSAFHRTIGRSTSRPLLYTVPTLNLNFPNGIRVGASYFYGFGALNQHERIRLHITLAPVRKEED